MGIVLQATFQVAASRDDQSKMQGAARGNSGTGERSAPAVAVLLDALHDVVTR